MPTPLAQMAKHGAATDWEINKADRHELHVVLARQLSTPTVSQIYKPVREPSPSEANGTHGRCLVADIIGLSSQETGERGVLNPSFVEAMMGFAIGWTDLEP